MAETKRVRLLRAIISMHMDELKSMPTYHPQFKRKGMIIHKLYKRVGKRVKQNPEQLEFIFRKKKRLIRFWDGLDFLNQLINKSKITK